MMTMKSVKIFGGAEGRTAQTASAPDTGLGYISRQSEVGADVEKQASSDATTWAGVASRALEIISESWTKMVVLCIFLLCIAAVGIVWWWLVAVATDKHISHILRLGRSRYKINILV